MAHYLQSITPCLALGGELVYHRRPGEEGTVMSLAGKYTCESRGRGWGRVQRPAFHMPHAPLVFCAPPHSLTVNNWLATVTLGQAGMHATYYHKASDQVSRARDPLRGRTSRARAARRQSARESGLGS